MAQASSAQREPSMEEILASIRRIIEDSDTTAAEDAEAGARDVVPATAEPADLSAHEEGGAEIVEVDSFRAEFEPEMDEPELPPEEAGPSPVRLSDIQAEVEARAAEMDAAGAEQPAPSSIPDRQPATHEQARSGSMDAERDGIGEASAAPGSHAGSTEQMDEGASAAASPAETASAEQAVGADAHMHRDAAPAILSEMTGRRVAAAFDELSGVFDTSRRKSFDEMAEEMLRPMLQDWLDNNLPTLVEKLVREEIERVARGGPR